MWLPVEIVAIDRFEEWLEVWPLNGILGRLSVGTLSTYVELRFEEVSKCPDRFSRSVDCIANPESLRDIGVIGKGGKELEVGDSFGEGGAVVELVDGLGSVFDGRKALNTGGLAAKFEALSPKEAELRPANFASALGIALPVNTPGFSDENVLIGKDSMA